ncbi:MAG TPA: glutamate--tRNA ligase [Acidobacteriota bacterium]|nr:glutamate--tRNA ligase [Acidobacteriota bacterium]
MQENVRVRFAPSPTGYLHVGGARTALYNFLYARKKNGVFVLRIEDTDVQRSSQEMVDVILNSLKWLQLTWDEGPYYQSQRLDLYRKAAFELAEKGKAYRCFCTPDEINVRREAGMKEKGMWKYDRLCYNLTPEEIERKIESGIPFAIRFLVPPGQTSFDDLVHGKIELDHSQVDDFVLLRSDGHPTYHLSVVVDDIDMKITHIVRGDDHISNTPKQILLYEAFEKQTPHFAHIPLILGTDKKRLSKRHGSVAVEEYQRTGILPEALVNFLALLGWNPGDEREIMMLDELVREFDLDRVNSSNAVFDLKKLLWMNSKYLSMIPLQRLIELLLPQLKHVEWKNDPLFEKRVDLMRTRAQTILEIEDLLTPFYSNDFPYDPSALAKMKKDPAVPALLEELLASLDSLELWNHQMLETQFRNFAESHGIKSAVIIHPVRLAISGKTGGPGLFEFLELMGMQNTFERMKRFIDTLRN